MERDDYERYLIAVIDQLQRDYQKAAEPFIKKLVDLRALDTSVRFTNLTTEQERALLDNLRQDKQPTSP